jgi:hypothetical protein
VALPVLPEQVAMVVHTVSSLATADLLRLALAQAGTVQVSLSPLAMQARLAQLEHPVRLARLQLPLETVELL